MDGFYMVSCRTDGMAPSDVKDALRDGRLALCPYHKLAESETDEILEGFLHRGLAPDATAPRCMSVTALGENPAGIPLARIEITDPASSRVATPAVCTYCPRNDGWCGKAGSFLMYDILADDPLWNACALQDDDDD